MAISASRCGAVLQILMEADVEGLIVAGRHERSADRLNYRNGYRERSLDTRLGSLQLRIPKLRQGSCYPPFLEAHSKGAAHERLMARRLFELLRSVRLSGCIVSEIAGSNPASVGAPRATAPGGRGSTPPRSH